MSPRKHGPPYHGQTHNHSHLTSAPGTGGTSTRVALHSQIRLPDELAAEELPARPLEHHAPGLEHVAPGREVERCRHVLLDEEHRQPLGAVETRQRLQRSEEHTSELQSLAYLVCRLLLEKKNTPELQSLAYIVCRLLLEKKKSIH